MLQGAALLMVAHDALRGRVKPLSDVSLGTERTRGGENDGDQGRALPQPPLDPLTAEEVSSAVEILRKERDLGEKVRFAGIVVNEPPKEQVLSFNLGDDFEREALVVLVDGEEEAAYEAVVSLGEGMVESWERIEGMCSLPSCSRSSTSARRRTSWFLRPTFSLSLKRTPR